MRSPRNKGGPSPDPTQIGAIAEAVFVRLPDPGHVFAARAARFTALAETSAMAPYLRFLGGIARLQHQAVAVLPAPALVAPDEAMRRQAGGIPPIDIGAPDGGALPAALAWFAAHSVDGATAEAEAARLSLLAMSVGARLDLARSVASGAFRQDRLGETLYAAAAVQVHAVRLAAALDPAMPRRRETGTCPVCGAAPAASLRVGWPRADKLRYCCCSLCGTFWNYVRVKCTSCASTKGISYYAVEGGRPAIGAECCDECGSYIKHLRHDEDTAIDPLADDVASYDLDVMLREEGYRRAGINPLFVIG